MINLDAQPGDAPSTADDQAVRIARVLCQADDPDTVCEELLRGTMRLYGAGRGLMVLRADRRCLYFSTPTDKAWPDSERMPTVVAPSLSSGTPWHWSSDTPPAHWVTLHLPEIAGQGAVLQLDVDPSVDAQKAAGTAYAAQRLLDLAATLLQTMSLRKETQRLADERRAQEAALSDVDAFMAEAQRISRTGSWTWDPTNPGADEWSPTMYAMLGYDPGNTVASFEANLARVHPDDRARYLQVLETAVAQGRHLDVEYRYLLPDGTVRHAHARGKQISPTLYIVTANDISERRAAEWAARKAHAELAAASRLTTLGELVASLSHELNQPFAAAVANAAASRRWLRRDEPDDHRARQSIESVLEDARRAQAIIASLRALARKSEPERRPVDLDEAIVEITALSRSEFDMHGVDLHLDLQGRKIPVLVDRVQLQQVALTLIMTCLESTREVHEHPRAISISTSWQRPDALVMAIEGCGATLDPSLIDAPLNLLDPAASGHLLGLSVCRSIVEAHDGTFRVADGSRPTCRFEVVLQRAAVAP